MRFGVVFLRSIEADLRGGVEGIIVTSASSSEGLSYAMAHRQGAVRESIRGVLSGRNLSSCCSLGFGNQSADSVIRRSLSLGLCATMRSGAIQKWHGRSWG